MDTNRYKDTKIYTLRVEGSDLTYYGSTTQQYLSSRLAGHKRKWKLLRQEKILSTCTSSLLFDINPDKVYITLVEKFPCESEDEKKARERYYIDNNECINRQIPGRSKAEYVATHPELYREIKARYRETHRERLRSARECPHCKKVIQSASGHMASHQRTEKCRKAREAEG